MQTTLLILHVVVCFFLIMVVLMQVGKGADMGSAFGGGSSQTLFGARGPQSFLGKLTTASAVIFMATSLFLAALSSRNVTTSVITEQSAAKEKDIYKEPAKPADRTEEESNTVDEN